MNKYSLSELLCHSIVIDEETNREIQFDVIEIPMIQRDYAQGRETEKNVRKRFLDAIFKAVTDNEMLEMDFVYGSVYESKEDKVGKNIKKFIPLDGQQRLTTLFLLYWYIGIKELRGEALADTMAHLHKFSYSTRASSRKFCADITDKYNDIAPKLTNSSPRKAITDFSWFYNTYEKDPTVKAMLNMLDEIAIRYCVGKCNDLFARLENLKFYVLPLDGFNLTEELYVKMNARGKSLTDFENFKADFIKWMKSDKNRDKDFFHKPSELDKREMEYYMVISQKLDGTWTDIFWQEIKDIPEKELHPYGYIVDPFFMRFFHRYLCNLTIQNNNFSDAVEEDEAFRYFYGDNGNDQNIQFSSFDNYEKLLDYKVIQNLEQILDALSQNIDVLRKHINPIWEEPGNWSMFDKSITQRQRIAFYATTLYLEKNKVFQEESYTDWMRVVWNLIIDPAVRNVSAMIRSMRQIKDFSVWSDDILSGLSTINKCDEIKSKIDEEASKARLILKDREVWGKSIFQAEAHPLLKGEICFLLPQADKTTIEDFRSWWVATEKIFEGNTFEDSNKDNYLWLRAALARNEYYPKEITLLNGRFDNWRTLINHQLVVGFRSIMNSVASNSDMPAYEILLDICRDYPINRDYPWVHPIVSWEGENGEILLEYSESKKIQKYNYYGNWQEQTYLYNKNRWTEGNIMLSSFRNNICAEIIKRWGFATEWEYGNIQNDFFRGSEVVLAKYIDQIKITFLFDTNFLRVGIMEYENSEFDINHTDIAPEFKANGWLWRKKYEYLNVNTYEELDTFLEKIENEILNDKAKNSLAYLIKSTN